MASGPSVPRRKAGHMAAPTSNVRKVNKPLAKPEPSTHGVFGGSRAALGSINPQVYAVTATRQMPDQCANGVELGTNGSSQRSMRFSALKPSGAALGQ
jgi:hypothetical protein